MEFWLGTHRPNWLERTGVPLMVSHRTLAPRKTLPRALGPWVLDSGGFTELSMFGEWRTTPGDYLAAVERYHDEIGNMVWAAPQDWMCEPWIIAKTGLSVREHQRRTVDNYLELTRQSEAPFIPVLQGWTRADYLDHIRMYGRAGVHLGLLPIVGLGSVCRRASERDIVDIIEELHGLGLKLHGFGVKKAALKNAGYLFESADSMAWSFTARRDVPLDGCTHKTCTNCLRYALEWRQKVTRTMDYQQPRMVFS